MDYEIQKNPCNRLVLTKCSPKENPALRLVVPFSNKGLDLAKPQRLISAVKAQFQLELPKIQIAWKYNQNVKLQVYNVNDIFRTSLDSSFYYPTIIFRCACKSLDPSFLNKSKGHLHCYDSNWISNGLNLKEAAQELDKGLNHIVIQPPSVSNTVQINSWICSTVLSHFNVNPQLVPEILKFAETWSVSHFTPSLTQTPPQTTEINFASIKSISFTTGLDKAENHPMYICKDYSLHLTLSHLHTSKNYLIVNSNPSTFITSSLLSLVPNIEITSDRIPVIFPVYKVKKDKYRYITSTSNTVYTRHASLAQKCCSLILSHLQCFAGQKNSFSTDFLGVPVQYFPLIKDSREAILNLPPASDIRSDFTADISQCYDSIPTVESDPQSLQSALKYSALLVQTAYIKSHHKAPSFWYKYVNEIFTVKFGHTNPNPKLYIELSMEAALNLCSFLVCNSYVQAGTCFAKQTLGIPQGIAAGPDWANLYLSSFEFRFLNACLEDTRTRNLLVDFPLHYWFRFIDDIRIINNPLAPLFMQLIYPNCLQIEPTCNPNPTPYILCTSSFLDIRSCLSVTDGMTTSTSFKSSSLPFDPIQYISPNSNRPLNACYNVCIGLILNVVYHCNKKQALLADLLFLFKRLLKNGFQFRKLFRTFRKCLDRNLPCVHFNVKEFWRVHSRCFFPLKNF